MKLAVRVALYLRKPAEGFSVFIIFNFHAMLWASGGMAGAMLMGWMTGSEDAAFFGGLLTMMTLDVYQRTTQETYDNSEWPFFHYTCGGHVFSYPFGVGRPSWLSWPR